MGKYRDTNVVFCLKLLIKVTKNNKILQNKQKYYIKTKNRKFMKQIK